MRIPVITGTVQESYKVLDSVCAHAIGSPERSYDFDTEVNAIFNEVKADLRSACKALGGNVVINCKFEVRNIPYYGRNRERQFSRTELYVHGTAVLSDKPYNDELTLTQGEIYSLAIDPLNCASCPICKTKLRLDSYEIKESCFKCINCNNEIKFRIEAGADGGVD